MNREEILKSEEVANLVNEFNDKYGHLLWEQFCKEKLNEGKFKTEDGVMVDKDEIVYGVDPMDNYSQWAKRASVLNSFRPTAKWFSTPAARQTYIEDNKPCLSKKIIVDGIERLINEMVGYSYISGATAVEIKSEIKKLIDSLVKSKL